MKTVKILFVDFWKGFDFNSNFITNTLRLKYNVQIVEKDPEYIFFSVFGFKHLRYQNNSSIKIFFSGENICPDFNFADYAIAFDHISFQNRYLRLPLYCIYSEFEKLIKPKIIDTEEVLNREFCSFVYSNSKFCHPIREDFFNELSKYKQISSGGKIFNNVGGRVPDKLEFIKKFKFDIAFENSSVNGYTTEKIMQPMSVNSLPIYWGNKLIDRDFNPRSFINATDFSSLGELVKYIAHLDQNDNEYLDILSQPWIEDAKYLNWQQMLLDFLSNIMDCPVEDAKIAHLYGRRSHHNARFVKNMESMIYRIRHKILG